MTGRVTKATRRQTRKPRRRDDEPERSELDDVLAQFESVGIRAKLQRENERTKRWDHLPTMDGITESFIDDVKDLHGGGNYRARLYAGAEYKSFVSFSIAGKPKDGDGDAPPTDRLARIEAALLKKEEPKSGADTVKEILAIVTPLGAAAFGGISALVPLFKGNGGTDPMAMLALMQSAEERGERRGVELGKLKAERGEGGGMMEVAKAYAQPLFKLLEHRRDTAAVTTTPAPTMQPNAPLPPPPPALPTAALPAGYEFLGPMRPFYPELLGQAQSDVQPEVIADFVLAKMGEDHLRAIDAAAKRPDFLTTMRAELEPIASQYPAWLDAFLARIVELCNTEEEEEPAPARRTPAKRARR